MEAQQAEEFDRLFRSTFRRVLAYCLRRTGEPAAHDAAAEVYAVAWRRRRHLPRDEHDAALWLLGVARKVLANQARGQRRWTRLLLRAAERAEAPEPGGAAPGAPDLTAALAGLSATDQELLRLAYWDDLPNADIATVLGISAGAVATRLHRARERLRPLLTTPRHDTKDLEHAE
ncbi:RNA polymerase sigma factor [Streptomyces hoynatensis]|uniref:Sigma-70 family RNA polymerase sigma factor n=1 Tax=Streptomyces hoynatensis TaxID=1141874 RepID=A0A3A9YPU3_9ACTN|nr:sigma-70 family RNA polymerase sigma factor [Streptomyces hoynatensis]RKN38022.1 sigma-70 family RNA polymerase sigma factor [Streptomyces hoynatensis]